VLKYALLGFLARTPSHGYDLKGAFETAMGGTWPVNIGQIYTTLGRLERDGLIESELIEQSARPDRKVYRLTQRGADELDGWIREPTQPGPPLHDELFIKYLVRQINGGAGTETLIADSRHTLQDALAAIERRIARVHNNNDEVVTRDLLAAVSHQLQAKLVWLDELDSAP